MVRQVLISSLCALGASVELGSINSTVDLNNVNLTSSLDWKEQRIVELLIQLRQRGHTCPHGKYFQPYNGPLNWDCRLSTAAKKWSQRMAYEGFIGHRHDGSTSCLRTEAEGYPCKKGCGEILAGGTESPEATLEQFKKSNDHCEVMLDPSFNMVGGGFAENPSSQYRWYYTIDFGNYWRSPEQRCIGGYPAHYPKAGCADTDCFNCEYYRNQGLCNTPNVRAACMDTCQIDQCADGSGPAPAPGPAPVPGCSDTDPNCAYYVQQGYCASSSNVRSACPSGCGLCDCRDTDSNCAYYASLGYCSNVQNVQTACRRTCGRCGYLGGADANSSTPVMV